MAVRGDNLKLSALASASNNPGNASLGTIAGSTASPISMSEFHVGGEITGITGFTYVVEDTTDSYDLAFTGTGARFDQVDLAQNFTWNVQASGSYTGSSYISIVGSPSSSCQISISTMNPQDPSSQTELLTQKEHYISASFADGFNTNVTGYNTVFGKTIYSVDTYNSNTALCLTADSLVELEDGTEMEIGDLIAGDELIGYNIEGLGDLDEDYLGWSSPTLSMTPETVKVVSVTFGFSDVIYNINNDDIKATYEHPLLVLDGIENVYKFKKAGTITKLDKLVKEEGLVDVTSIQVQKGESIEIVSIDVETQDTFVVNGYIHHNKGGNSHTDQDTIAATTPVIYLNPDSIDPDAVSAGDSLTGANIWESALTGNALSASIGSGTFQLNIGSIDGGRQVQWSAGGWLDLPYSADAAFTAGTNEYTVIWRLGDNIGTTTEGYALSNAISTGNQRMFGLFMNAGPVWGNLYVGGNTIAPSDTSVNPNELYICTVQTGSVNLWKDGVKIVDNWTGFGSAPTGSLTQSWNIGGRSDGSYDINAASWSMDVIAVIPKAITTNERLNIENEFKLN
jgi:hypothetical protein